MYLSKITKTQGTPPRASAGNKKELEEFTIWLSRLGYAESTIESYQRLLNNFFNYLKGSVPTQKKVEEFNYYLHQTTVSGCYIESHLNVINKYSEFLEKVKKRKLVVSRLVVEKKIKEEREAAHHHHFRRCRHVVAAFPTPMKTPLPMRKGPAFPVGGGGGGGP